MDQAATTRGDMTIGLLPAAPSAGVEWGVSAGLVGYPEALASMAARAAAIARGEAPELVWLLEHPPLYTAGTSARPEELVEARFPVHSVGRGGQFTYHGPGQRVGYVMLDLKRRAPDVRRFVATLEEWIIRALARFNIFGERRGDRVGVWVRRPDKGQGFEDKIAAIGVRVQRWVTLHGFRRRCGAPRRVRAAIRHGGGRSNATQHREQFVAAAQCDFLGRRLALIDCLDPRTGRAATTFRNHRGNVIVQSAK